MKWLEKLACAGLLSLLVACGGGDSELYVAMPELGLDVVFIVGEDAQGRAREIAGPVVLDESEAGDRRAVLDGDAARLRLIGWRHEDLEALSPLYDRARVAELELSLGGMLEPACAEELEAETASLQTAAPESTQAHILGLDGGSEPAVVPSNAVLRLPVDLENCVPESQRVFRPFADQEFPVPLDSVIDGRPLRSADDYFGNVRALGDGRVLVASFGALFILEPGQPFVAESSHAFVARSGLSIEGVAIDASPARHPDGPLVVLSLSSEFRRRGAIVDLRLTDAGLERVRTTSVSLAYDELVIRPADGRLVGVSGRGAVMTRSSFDAPIETVEGVWTDTGNNAVLGLTGDASQPYAIGGPGRGGVLLGDVSASQWTSAPAEGFDINARVREIASLEEGTRAVWVGTSDGRVFVWEMGSERWGELPLLMPPGFQPCGTPAACGYLDVTQTIRGIRPFERDGGARAFVSLSSCVVVIDVRRDGRCAGLVRVPGRPLDDVRLSPMPPETFDFRAIDASDTQLVLASQEGGVYVLDLEP